MPVNHIDFVDTRLAAALKSTDTQMKIRATRGLLRKINALPIGDHAYFVVQTHGIVEVVCYTHTSELAAATPLTLVVERGQHDTVATSFPANTCVRTELTKSILDEIMEK